MCSVNCDGCYAKNHCDVVPNSMNCQEVREEAEKEQRIRADERLKFAEWIEQHFNNDSCLYTNCDGYDSFNAEKALSEYEKEQKEGAK